METKNTIKPVGPGTRMAKGLFYLINIYLIQLINRFPTSEKTRRRLANRLIYIHKQGAILRIGGHLWRKQQRQKEFYNLFTPKHFN